MAKKRGTKRGPSLSALPKGLPVRKKTKANGANPFEAARVVKGGREKHVVHNRPTSLSKAASGGQSALARSLARRKEGLQQSLLREKKANSFIDRRIGEHSSEVTHDEKMLARIVRERSRRSKKSSKYQLDDGDDDGNGGVLTHKGRAIDESFVGNVDDDIILSDDDEDGGELDRVDTEMHFGGGNFDRSRSRAANANPYGDSSRGPLDMGDAYRSRKDELDEMIHRKKMIKAEKAKTKEDQVEAFTTMDESFKELSSLLQFRDKEEDRRKVVQARREGTQSKDEQEMDAWDSEMKQYLFERKVKATDRTKTPEEIAKNEADRLHELETKRLARMNNDFENDDLSDVSDDEDDKRNRKRKAKASKTKNPDELDGESDEEDDKDKLEARFTADGLVYLDSDGKVVKKLGDEEEGSESPDIVEQDEANESDKDDESESEDEGNDSLGNSDDEASAASAESDEEDQLGDTDPNYDPTSTVLEVGAKIKGNYRAGDQFEGKQTWYNGTISAVHTDPKTANITYDVTYDDGDFEDGITRENVRPILKKTEEVNIEEQKKLEARKLKMKRIKAKTKARTSIPFVFEVPTTLEALHDMIGNFASTGADASLIVQRIHASNSVRLNKNNREKMQNFYDVLLRRFIAVGDAIYTSGDGGPDLERYEQLNCLTKTLYAMSQDSPECAGAVWNRRLGIFQKALGKRLRDSELIQDEDEDAAEFSVWPSCGTFLLLRALGHIFPVTDMRHPVVTPAILLIGQMIAQAPVKSISDLTMGVFLSGLMLEYTKDAKRVAPEALAFLAGVLRLFSLNVHDAALKNPVPSLEAAVSEHQITSLRLKVGEYCRESKDHSLKLSLEKEMICGSSMPASILYATLHLIEMTTQTLDGALNDSDAEVFVQITQSLLCIDPKNKDSSLTGVIANKLGAVVNSISKTCRIGEPRPPLMLRKGATTLERSVKSLAPRIEDPTRYAMSKDKGKKSEQQSILDRNRREYKREHKAVSRELRLDAAFVENIRRTEKQEKDSAARNKRNKNHAWLEQEQATMNQQVRMGGGLLQGGGTGAARAKARSGKLGIKKGGKMS